LEGTALATGRVLQVNVSEGGVPKLPVERAWVSRLGVEGDRHREYSVHGGPHKAVCLFGIEAIERLQSEGHPMEPGAAGENLTTVGIEWSLMPVGSTIRIGNELEVELSSPANPCNTQRPNFSDGRFSRISIDHHPSDSRMYARVLREGSVQPGDEITVTAPAPDSHASDFLVMKRLDRVERKSSVAAWSAAREAGIEIDFVEDGDLSMCASAEAPGPAFNHSSGLAQYPNLLPMVAEFYDRHGSTGWIWAEELLWEGAQPDTTVGVFAALPDEVTEVPPPAGIVIRHIGREDADRYISVRSTEPGTSGVAGAGEEQPNPWDAVYTILSDWPHRFLFLAELDGKPVGVASLHTNNRTGWLRGALVAPEARGRGIQRALLWARVAKAKDVGCDLVGSWAEPDGPSSTNIERMGLRRVGTRHMYVYTPGETRLG
jgi:MOSC domain-containing protein YiiM/GNAT superfamily N-acetyltransferase